MWLKRTGLGCEALMTFAASPSHLREASGMSSPPPPQHPQPFPRPLELGRLLSQAPGRQLSGRGCAWGNPARRAVSPKPNKPARSFTDPPPPWGNPAGLGLGAAVRFGEISGWESGSRELGASLRAVPFPLPHRGQGSPWVYLCSAKGDGLSVQAKSPDAARWGDIRP